MRNADKADILKKRILNLIDNITYQTFIYTSRGLFEKDKLTFICQMTFQVIYKDLMICIFIFIVKHNYTNIIMIKFLY